MPNVHRSAAPARRPERKTQEYRRSGRSPLELKVSPPYVSALQRSLSNMASAVIATPVRLKLLRRA